MRSAWPEDLTIHLTLRGMGYAAYLALIAPALVLGGIRRFSREPIAAFWAVSLTTFAVFVATSSIRETIDTYPVADRDLGAAAVILSDVVPDWGRFAVDQSWEARELHRVGNVAHWLVAKSGASAFNGFNPETSASSISPLLRELDVGDELHVGPGTEGSLAALGVTHLVSFNPKGDAWSLGVAVYESPTVRVSRLATNGPFTVAGPFGPIDQAHSVEFDVGDLQYRPGRLRARVDTTSPILVDAAVGFSPRWHLTIDGRATDIVPTEAGTISFGIDEGSHLIELEHRLGGAHNLGLAISLVSAVGLMTGLALRSSRRRARSDTQRHR
ncbi:MAG: hypothetical protein IH940_06290 [Acidobacteria bacterium]|nr:hypothetical protein [Acidobacteriota bacterium]